MDKHYLSAKHLYIVILLYLQFKKEKCCAVLKSIKEIVNYSIDMISKTQFSMSLFKKIKKNVCLLPTTHWTEETKLVRRNTTKNVEKKIPVP